ncbi:hypothetical protein CHELA20_53948 [Hyphomicrobiales bacterium]|nr:hypothetical protein CHELA41_20979 [Hyphomicrobiales bacterium]CAH1685284.1 hypothetical protein CHELA20_53948 [Hyphomicrobiales bacterium]
MPHLGCSPQSTESSTPSPYRRIIATKGTCRHTIEPLPIIPVNERLASPASDAGLSLDRVHL